MPLLGDAAVAMWWSVPKAHQEEFQEWHSKEHLPERLSIPGFRRGSRWQREDGEEFFVIYELADHNVLVSAAYRERLNAPTPWSTAMMPFHRNMVRSQCRIRLSNGQGVATFMCTVRLSPLSGDERRLEHYLRAVLEKHVAMVGVTGAHLLRTETPETSLTKEQEIRGGDQVADWIVLVSGHNACALQAACSLDLAEATLSRYGGRAIQVDPPFRLVHAMVSDDVGPRT